MIIPPERPFSSPPDHPLLPGVSQQPNPATQATLTEHWTKIVLSYARFRRLFTLRVEDAETSGGDWDEVLRNPRINRTYAQPTQDFLLPYSRVICLGKLLPSHLEYIISQMVAKNLAVYEPAKQTRSVQLYWRLPEEWAEVLHEWVLPTKILGVRLSILTAGLYPPSPGVFHRSAQYHHDLL